MKKKTFASFALVVILLISLFGTAAAQAEEPVDPEPVATSTPAPSKFLSHPIVQILSAYFSRDLETATPEPTEPVAPEGDTPVTVDPDAPVAEPSEVPTATPSPQEIMAQEIATYHEEGMGFGQLVKLYSIAEAARAACPPVVTVPADDAVTTTTDTAEPTEPACTAVTVDELVTALKSGAGMGSLFKEYGKPAMLGVGHVKHAKPQVTVTPVPDETTVTGDEVDTTLKTDKTKPNQGHKPVKTKAPKVKGPKK